MKISLPAVILVFAARVFLLAQSPTLEHKKATVNWLQSLQRKSGGFSPKAGDSGETLEATTFAVRARKLFGGEVSNTDACKSFVTSCYVKTMAGFAPAPGEKVDVPATATGLIAAAELKLPMDQYVLQPVIFLCSRVKSFDEIRRAAAGYEAVQTKCELAKDWADTVLRMQNADGTFGKDAQSVRDTADAVVALTQLGAPVEKKESTADFLKSKQNKDGGWGTDGSASDLESTYRVLHALVVLKQHLNRQEVHRFVASCRNSDGSYGLRPETAGQVSAVFYAGTILRWLDNK